MFVRSLFAVILLTPFAVQLSGAAAVAVPMKDPSPAEVQNIIKRFTQNETDFAAARQQYVYRQTAKLTEVQPVGGTYEMVEDILFDDRGRRTSRVVRAPVASLQNIQMSPEDEKDLRDVMPFVVTNKDADEYTIKYLRREKVDEISCYVFSLTPKQLTKDRKRYFDGEIWVDDQDLQIVKTFGRATGYLKKSEDQQFPKFQTYREQIDGKYWFPTYTYADDTLNFREGQSQRIKQVVKYENYKRFKSESTIQYEPMDGATPPAQSPQTAPPPATPAPPPAPPK